MHDRADVDTKELECVIHDACSAKYCVQLLELLALWDTAPDPLINIYQKCFVYNLVILEIRVCTALNILN